MKKESVFPMPNAQCPMPNAPSQYFPGGSSQNLHTKAGDNPHT